LLGRIKARGLYMENLVDLKILTKEIRQRGLSKTQTRLSIIRAYVFEYYTYSNLDWMVYEIQAEEGISTNIAHLKKLAKDMGVRRASRSETAVYNQTAIIFQNGACGFADHYFTDDTGREWVAAKIYVNGSDTDYILVKVNVPKKINGNIFSAKTRITSKTVLNVDEDHFYCNGCNAVHPRSFARQKGVSGGNTCKSCYNKKRLKEFKDPMKRKRCKIYQLTHMMITGFDTSGNPYRGLNKKRIGKGPTDGYKYLGCTSEEFQQYIEGQLPSGWTLSDRGTLWELDHIEPLSNFNLMNDSEMKKAAHFTNIRPLAKSKNRGRRASGVASWGKDD
jgi:hypothetical protein